MLKLCEIETPGLIFDLNAIDRNIERMRKLLNNAVAIRPHFKCHRCTELARRQLQAGAIGLTCATVGEAEILAQAGLFPILLANQIVTPVKADRFARLARAMEAAASPRNLICLIDSPVGLEVLSRAAEREATRIGVLIELDLGMNRGGARSIDGAVGLCKSAVRTAGIVLCGVSGYEGHLIALPSGPEKTERVQEALAPLFQLAECIGDLCDAAPIVSGSGTGTVEIAAGCAGLTEIQAGTYVLMDELFAQAGAAFEPACWIRSTVISRHGRRAICDAGRKSLHGLGGLPRLRDPRVGVLTQIHAEHGLIDLSSDAAIDIGDTVEIIPYYLDGTINLHSCAFVTSDGEMAEVWPIDGRIASPTP